MKLAIGSILMRHRRVGLACALVALLLGCTAGVAIAQIDLGLPPATPPSTAEVVVPTILPSTTPSTPTIPETTLPSDVPTPTPTLEPGTLPVSSPDAEALIGNAKRTVNDTVDDLLQPEPIGTKEPGPGGGGSDGGGGGGGGTGGGSGGGSGGGGGGETDGGSGTGGGGTGGGSSAGSGDGARSGAAKAGEFLADAPTYGAVGPVAAQAAGRVLDLAGPMAPSIALALIALFVIAAIGRGSRKLVTLEHMAPKTAFRL